MVRVRVRLRVRARVRADLRHERAVVGGILRQLGPRESGGD